MDMKYFTDRARGDFNKARNKAMFTRILTLLTREKDELLSFEEVKALVKPESETYGGVKTVPISLVVGSEGRYRDFNRFFLPRHQHLHSRWERVDLAHYQQIDLPPVNLYEIGGVYFVRDGNHRVSVARAQGIEFIDAEVISLGSKITLEPGMSRDDLKRAVIDLEKKEFFKKTRLDQLRPQIDLEFTATGRYDEIIRHINGHKYFLNLSRKAEISFEEGVLSWYDIVFAPIVDIVRAEKILTRFPGRKTADL